MKKKYIEFILENQEHMKKIQELDNISKEIGDHLLGKIERTSNGILISESKVHDLSYLERELERLIEDNYFMDNDCDCFGMIEQGYMHALYNHFPLDLIEAITTEQTRRHTRKRHPKKSWEKLRSYGLETVDTRKNTNIAF